MVGTIVALAQAGAMPVRLTAAIGVMLPSLLAAIGVVAARRAAGRTAGVEAIVWRLFGHGLLAWALGCLPYVAFLATGGDIASPAAWSQIGFLAAYPFWYRALWLLRQPALAETRRERLDGWAIELSILGLMAVIVVGTLWEGSLPAAQNVALLIPVALDLLLIAALYNAMRRSSFTRRSALVWFSMSFSALALTDAAVTYLVTRGFSIAIAGSAYGGYLLAMALMALAARRPIRVTEARAVMGPTKTLLAAIGLALSGPAGVLIVPAARPVIWALAVLLLWRLRVLLREHDSSETDPLSGFLEHKAFTRHVGGVVQAADSGRRALLVAVDLDGFARWNAQHGYGAGDGLLADLAGRLEASELTGGVWGRLGADRFAWIGIGHDAESGRRLAEMVQAIAAGNSGGLTARATFVVLPDDAENAVNAMAAAEEGLGAAKAGRRRVVAFDRGHLDGVDFAAGYTASLAQRRDSIIELLAAPETITTVFQPIVALDDGRTVGFESLSRFRAEPQRPPDRWIAEAHAVGLGLEIEVECVRRAMRLRGTIPAGAYLSVNMSPDAILAPEMDAALGDGDLDGVVIEITEHEAVGDYARLSSRLADYRGRGALVAIDDAGAGHASMRHVTQLAPDYIKIDRSLIHDIHMDHAKRALVRSMVTLEKDLGAEIVAEGIESDDELATLRELGVPYGQGFLLARPAAEAVPAAGGPVAAAGEPVAPAPAVAG
ncbi:EAL domain-containing protein [Miltoncostaea marina]|uniref:EAL domain-containing protein n=1 Tax=Miltoncostaea marina TaxID=2843215 RepID=UPI001C3C50A6|nr:bifunctional diguanylate cyclase/phosphodiesterase [Miltoncostaea marina]